MPTAVTKRRGFRKSVAATDDEAAPPAKEGMLKKKNKNGIWQKRFFWINNHYINYSKQQESKVTGTDIIGAVNLLELDDIKETGCEFIISFSDVSYHLKAKTVGDMEQWVKCIQDRRDYYSRVQMKAEAAKTKRSVADETFRESRLDDNGDEEPSKEGWLKKKSPGKMTSWQDRYIRIYTERGELLYYKTSSPDAEAAGTVAINNMEWCRPYDESDTCTIFEFLASNRAYQWKAESNASLREWVSEIKNCMEEAKDNSEVFKEARILANTSRRLLTFDSLSGDLEKQDSIKDTLDIMFANLELGMEMEHLVQAEENVEQELGELALECRETAGRPARYDILAFHIQMYHSRMLKEVKPFLDATEEAENDLIYQLIMLILKYSKFLGDLLLHVPEDQHPQESLLSQVKHLSDVFVNGPNGSIMHIAKVCKSAAARQTKEGMSEVNTNSGDGKGYTSTVIDVWKAINDHIQLARTTGASTLEYLVVEGALEEFIGMLHTLQSDLEEHGMAENRGADYVCACINDCTQHADQIATLSEEALSTEEIREKIDPLVDRVTRALNKYAMTGVGLLSGQVMQDMTPVWGKYFDSDWKEGNGNAAATIVATIDDYLQEYDETLVEYYVRKLALDLVSRAVVAFVRVLMKFINAQNRSLRNIAQKGTKAEHAAYAINDMDVLEQGLLERLQSRTRPGAFLLLDDIRVFIRSSEEDVIATVETIAGTFPEASKPYQNGLQGTVSVFVKMNQSCESKILTQKCMQRINETIEGGNNRGDVMEPGPYDKLALYQQLKTKTDASGSVRDHSLDQIDEPDADGGEINDDWNPDLEMESQRQRAVSAALAPEKSQDDLALGLNSEKHMEGYLEKKDSKNFWYKRWFVLETKLNKKSDKREVTFSWHLNPGTPAIHSVILEEFDDEHYANIKECKEKIVRDEIGGTLYLAKDFPGGSTIKLKSHSHNVVTLYTKNRKFKLRGKSPMYAVQWTNALNEAMAAKSVTGNVALDDLHRTRTQSVNKRVVTGATTWNSKTLGNKPPPRVSFHEENSVQPFQEDDAVTNILHMAAKDEKDEQQPGKLTSSSDKLDDVKQDNKIEDLEEDEPINHTATMMSSSMEMDGPLLNKKPAPCGCCSVS